MAKSTDTKKLTDSDKLAMVIGLLKANGFTLPDELDDSTPAGPDAAAPE